MSQDHSARLRRQRLLGSASMLCLALLLAEPVQAQTPTGRPAFLERFHFSVEGSLLFNRSDNAFSGDPTTLVGNLPPLDLGRNGYGLGLAVGGAIDPSWDWRLGWRGTWLQSNRANAGAPTGFGTQVFATTQTAFQTFDAEIGYRVPLAGPVSLRLFAGPRVVQAQTNIAYGYEDAFKLGSFDHDSTTWGVGPRAGLDATFALPQSPLFFNVQGSASAVFARAEHRYRFVGDDNGTPFDGLQNFGISKTLYNFEGSAAIGYHFTNMASFQLGYRVQHWDGLGTAVRATDDIGGAVIGSTDILTHGPFAKFTVSLP